MHYILPESCKKTGLLTMAFKFWVVLAVFMAVIPFLSGQGISLFDPFATSAIILDPFDDLALFDPFAVRRARDISSSVFNVKVDWQETPESHIIRADIPGFGKEDTKVSVVDGRTLEIRGERKEEEVDNRDQWQRVERVKGYFWRKFRLPENADVENVKAEVENGVLTVTVPKKEQPKSAIRHVEISSTAHHANEEQTQPHLQRSTTCTAD
ncbi:hypothetical protein O6H91_04G096400 [Diphasiastrum complanatum]|uniref:Uncharacterized protein n=1 Tax=Diphasiastrum complanatum TaxID=34168 RepID=A0ACC2DZL2_DIPCM|nr:hypothetical protein O6H91_04G096400 [Diphasiastrum complanatum]